jgi:hypothetical protein
MKNESNNLTVDSIEGKIDGLLLALKNKINKLKGLNFIETFPDNNINEINNILPQLKIDKDGFAGFDVEEVLSGFNLDPEFYKEDELSAIDKHFFESNENFNINEIITIMSTLKPADGIELEQLLNTSNNDENIPDQGKEMESGKIPEIIPDLSAVEKFKTKNATIIIDINNTKHSFEKVTFSLGGLFSSLFAKPGYNLNIRGDDILYGRKQFKIRSDGQDPTFLRIKLISDIRNRLGFPSVSASFVQLYINDGILYY